MLSSSQKPEIASLIQSAALQRTDNQLALTFQYPSAKLYEMIKANQDKIDISAGLPEMPEPKP